MSDLNPQIVKTKIGISELREIKIYPLSIHSQQTMGEEIQNVLKNFFSIKELKEEENEDLEENKIELKVSQFVADFIKKNIGILIALSTGEEDEDILSGAKANPILKELTNLQTIEIGDIIYKQNYGEALGKLKSLVPQEMIARLIENFSK